MVSDMNKGKDRRLNSDFKTASLMMMAEKLDDVWDIIKTCKSICNDEEVKGLLSDLSEVFIELFSMVKKKAGAFAFSSRRRNNGK